MRSKAPVKFHRPPLSSPLATKAFQMKKLQCVRACVCACMCLSVSVCVHVCACVRTHACRDGEEKKGCELPSQANEACKYGAKSHWTTLLQDCTVES